MKESFPQVSVLDVAILSVLAKAPGPLGEDAIVEALQKKGVEEPRTVVYTTLSRLRHKFVGLVQVKNNGFVPTDLGHALLRAVRGLLA